METEGQPNTAHPSLLVWIFLKNKSGTVFQHEKTREGQNPENTNTHSDGSFKVPEPSVPNLEQVHNHYFEHYEKDLGFVRKH